MPKKKTSTTTKKNTVKKNTTKTTPKKKNVTPKKKISTVKKSTTVKKRTTVKSEPILTEVKNEEAIIENKDLKVEINNIKPTKEEKEKRKINLGLVYFISILFIELIYQITIFDFNSMFPTKIIYFGLFALIMSVILNIITRLFSDKFNKIVSFIIVFLLSGCYFGLFVFKRIFNTFFSFHLLGISDQAVAFMDTTISEVLKNFSFLLLFIIPFIVIILFNKKINYKKNNIKQFTLNLLFLAVSIVLFIISINSNNEIKELFYNIDSNAMNVEKMGINVSTYLDIKRIINPIEEKVVLDEIPEVIENNNEEEITFEPNKEDIDFDGLIAGESNSTIKSMHEYFSKQNPTYKNEYTGIYEGKNLIFIMGESLNNIAISEKYTPTLYKLSHEGFEFTNFYTPVNLSTLGGEFQDLTGLFANLGMLSTYFRGGTNYFPYGLGNVFNNLGYEVNAYHPNYGGFQDRNKYLKSMGFDKFLARGNGLEKKMNCNLWPQSDYDMVNVTLDDFIKEDKFMTYYVSVSGHMPWSFSGNNMSRRNKDKVSDLKMSEEAKAYVAANIELDKAVEQIINKLTEENKLDDTVIVIVPDHYPYSMNINTINELSDYKRDERFEVNHSSLIIWNNNSEHKVIDKITTQLDVLPTVLNMFNVKYDSRLIIGKDIFSTENGLAFFTDRSWISDLGRYNAATGKFIALDGKDIPEDYVSKMNKVVANRINMSKLIMQYNYYKKVLK